jgi:hypothetical protein
MYFRSEIKTSSRPDGLAILSNRRVFVCFQGICGINISDSSKTLTSVACSLLNQSNRFATGVRDCFARIAIVRGIKFS